MNRESTKLRALVVDDSAYNRRTITKILERSPFIEVVGTAKDGEEALRRTLDLRPDLVTLDLEMPKMNGYQLIKTMRATPKFSEIPVLLLTARDTEEDRRKAMSVGASAFLVKGEVGGGRLLEIVGQFFERSA